MDVLTCVPEPWPAICHRTQIPTIPQRPTCATFARLGSTSLWAPAPRQGSLNNWMYFLCPCPSHGHHKPQSPWHRNSRLFSEDAPAQSDFEEWWSHCWDSGLLLWLRDTCGGNPTDADHCGDAAEHNAATVATAKLIMKVLIALGSWGIRFIVFPQAIKYCNKMLSEMTLQRCLLCPGPAWRGQQGQGTCAVMVRALLGLPSSRHCPRPLRQAEQALGPDPPPRSYMTKQTLMVSESGFSMYKMKTRPHLGH